MLRLPLFLAAVAALAFLALPPSNGTPGAQANAEPLSLAVACSPEAVIGGLVQEVQQYGNSGVDDLNKVSGQHTVLGDITSLIPGTVPAGGGATAYLNWLVPESLWTPLQPLINTVNVTYVDPSGVNHVASDDCSVDIPHLSLTKELIVNPDGTTTLVFTLTNDGSVPLRKFRVIDSVLGDITHLFPFELAVGETKTVSIPSDECRDTVTAAYQSVPRATTVVATAECTPGKGSIRLTKIFEIGPFTQPIEKCFKLDPPAGIDPAEQCATVFAPGPGPDEVHAIFLWRELPFGNYTVAETKVVPEGPYILDPTPIAVTLDEANPSVEVGPITNPLQPGTLRVEKRKADGTLWSTPPVTFHVCRGSLADCTPATPSFVQSIVVGDGNPNPSNPIFLPEDFYTVCEVVPAGFTPDPSRCQVVQVFAGDVPTAAFVSVKNVPTGEGCTPGYWRNHLDEWVPTGLSPGDDFDATFGVDLFDPDITLEQAINAKGGGVNKLARHGTAALLSALHPGVSYPFSAAEVIALVQAGDADALAAANELGCPLN